MKLSHARIIAKDVPALTRFYQQLTGIPPVGNGSHAAEKASA